MAKEGSTVRGLMDTVATLVSICLQYGVPLEDLVRKFEYVKFEPQGMTNTDGIRFAHSIIDYIFRWLGKRFLKGPDPVPTIDEPDLFANATDTNAPDRGGNGNGGNGNGGNGNGGGATEAGRLSDIGFKQQSDAPACADCGSIMVRNGSCYKCINCGTTTGCS